MSSGSVQISTAPASPGPYPQSVLRPAQSDGTLAFVLLIALSGAASALVWRLRQRRSTPLEGLPDPSPFPLTSHHEAIQDPKYLSQIVPHEDSAAS